jgi:hypothetical protein
VDAQTYTLKLPVPANSTVKYRYLLTGNTQAIEDTSADAAVRYRMLYATGPTAVRDIVASWTGQPFTGASGSIQGQVYNASSNAPVPNILVTAGGISCVTDSAGRFNLSGLPVGDHNLVAYAMDGGFHTFEQGARVAADLVTPVQVRMNPAAMVNVVFTVSVPANTQPGAPVRIAGNLLQFGNTFAELDGGLSTVADRMPTMTLQSDGRYALTISLPAGADLTYKYTLGDGFWNAEHKSSGEFVLRRLIVPEANTSVQDTVETWQAGPSAPIQFEVSVPADTPAADVVYIQFNPYAWTEPIPMWPLGSSRWAYKLYGPLNVLGRFGYRYCRAGQCGVADDAATPGFSHPGRSVTTSLTAQDLQDTVSGWTGFQQTGPNQIVGTTVVSRGGNFAAGVEFLPSYAPDWLASNPQAVQNVQGIYANWLLLTPTWTYTRANPLVFGVVPGSDPLWSDSLMMAAQAKALNLNVAFFPVPRTPAGTMADWWRAAPRDAAWWNNWFDRYHEFAINYADLASQSGATALVLGGEAVLPALPGGLIDGQPSGVPSDAETRWRVILADVRTHYKGQLWWALPYRPAGLVSAPAFVADVDVVYLLWNAPLSDQSSPAMDAMSMEAGRLLDQEVAPYLSMVQKPVVIGLAVPSITGTANACPADGRGGCLDWPLLSPPNPDSPSVFLDMDSQETVYEAMLNAVNSRNWISGLVSRGYYPPTILLDKSASVHGKPAADLLWYWFPRFLGITK